MGLSLLLRRRMFVTILLELFTHRALSYVMGLALVLIGLILVLTHNLWTSLVESIITLFGWLILLEGVLYLFISSETFARVVSVFESRGIYYFVAFLYLVLGGYLAWWGFF